MPRLIHSGRRGLGGPGNLVKLSEAKSTLEPKKALKNRQRAVSPASPEQRAKVAGEACVVCGAAEGVHPMHTIDRSMGGDDDPLCTVPGCFNCHRAYDEGKLSLLEYLEPNHRAELGYAVQLVGLLSALRRITNSRWEEVA